MKVRIVRIALLSLLAIVVVAVSLVLTVDFGRFKPQIESAVSDAIQREFEIAGPLNIDLGGTISVSAQNIRIDGAEWGSGDLLEIGRLAVSIDTWSLLSGPVTIDLLEVERLAVILEENEAGENNWTFPAGEEPPDTSAERLSLPVLLHSAQVSDFNLRYESPALAAPIALASGMTTVSTTDPDGLAVSSTGDLNGTPFRLEANAGDFAGLMALSALRIETEGDLGEIAFDAAMSLDDVQNPSRPVVDLNLSGPDVEYLTSLLNMAPVTSGPLALESRIAPDGENMQVTVSGRFGEFTSLITGRFVDLRDLDNAALQIAASGPNTAHVAGLLGLDGAPDDPFNVVGNVTRAGAELTVEGLTVTIGQTQFRLDGLVRRFPNPDGAVANLTIEGPDIGRFKRLMGLSGPLEGAFRLDAELAPLDGGGARLAVEGAADDVRFTIDGEFTADENLVGSRADITLAGPDLRTITDALDVADIPAHAFEISGSLQRGEDGVRVDNGRVAIDEDVLNLDGLVALGAGLTGTRVNVRAAIPDPAASAASFGVDTANVPIEAIELSGVVALEENGVLLEGMTARTGPVSANFDGRVALPAVEQGTELGFSLEGRDLTTLLPENPAFRALDRPFSLTGNVALDGGFARLSSLTFDIDESQLIADIDVGLDASPPQVTVRLRANSPDLYRLSPDLESVALLGTAPFELVVDARFAGDLLSIDRFEAQIAEGSVNIQGTVDGPPSFDRTDLDVDVHIDDMRQLSVLAGRELPQQSIDIRGRLAGRSESVKLEDFAAKIGDSDLSGTVEYRAGSEPFVSVALRSNMLDLTPFRPGAGDAGEEVTETPADPPPADERLIPGEPLPFERLQGLRADARVDVAKIRDGHKSISDIKLVATLDDGELTVSDFSLDTDGSGELWGRFGIRSREEGAEVGMRLYGSNLVIGLPANTPEELAALPRYDLNLAFITNGRSPRDLAGNVNGYVKFTSGEGQVRTGALRMFTNDFLMELLNTVNPFAGKNAYMQLECTAVLAAVEDGQLVGKPALVVKSDRLNIFADAKIDLKSERLDADFNTAANKGIGVSLSNLVNPYVKVQGTLAKPVLVIDPQGALIGGGTAVATGGLSILAKGLRDRFFSAKDPCAVAVADAEEQFAALEAKYGGQRQAENP